MRLLIFFLITTIHCFAQDSPRQLMLDSVNQARATDKGVFNLYVKKGEVEVITGVFRNRITSQHGFEPVNFTYNIYLPFQFDLNYMHMKAHEKLFKINVLLVVNQSKSGAYGLGAGTRFSFLIFKKAYLSYQLGLIWCEPAGHSGTDGISYRGLCFHHEFSFSYSVTKHVRLSANILHISNGNIFKNVKNNQDVIGIGVGYAF